MRPIDSSCAAIDDEMEVEPMTVPRPRTVSGVVLTGGSGGGAAEPGWSIAEDSSPGSADPAQDSGIYPIFEDGGAALDWVQRRRAVQKVTAEIEQSPDDPALYLKRAAAKVELGAPKEALEDCGRALSIRPDCVDGYLARAAIYFDLEAFYECADDCAKALRIDRARVEAYHRRASARAAIGDYASAVADYDEAIMLRPQHAWLFKDRGEMKSRLGDLNGALDDLNVAVAMSPDDEDALFKRNLVKVMLADNRGGPVDWGKAAHKALQLMSKKSEAKALEEEDDRIA
jgi:tetratricopeptide (TPR) repeat protein